MELEEELAAITRRLDQLQGVALAQQVFLVALGQELRQKDWTSLLGMDTLIDKCMDELRHSTASDLTLIAFQQKIGELTASLDSVGLGTFPD